MSEPTATPPPLPQRAPALELRPGFRRAALGIWLLTWRGQFTFGRLPLLLVTLTAIPLLAFFTIEPLRRLTKNNDWLGQPLQQVNEFKGKLMAANVPVKRGIGTQLVQIITEEQARIEPPRPSTTSSDGPRFSEEALNHQVEQVRAAHDRIRERVRPLLEDRQFKLFQQLDEARVIEANDKIRKLNLSYPRPFYRWLINAYLMIVLPLYCLMVCGAMIRDELQADTLGFLTTRPLGRGRLFLIRYLCQILWLQGMTAVHALLLFGVGVARDVPGVASVWGLFFGAQALAVFAWGALGAFLGLVTRRYLVLGIVYGFVVELGLGHIPTNINSVSLTRHLQALLVRNGLLNELYEWAPQNAWFSVGMLGLATVIYLVAGMALFTFREYHHATEMQK